MSFESVEIRCPGYSVQADWYPVESDSVLLSLIGRTSTKAEFGPMVEGIADKAETSALTFDYTGHGDSPFKFNEIMPVSHHVEVVMAFDWLRQEHPDKKINIFGTSYGGFLAANLVQYRKPSNLVLATPAIYRYGDFYKKTGDQRADPTIADFRSDQQAVAEHPLFTESPAKFAGSTLVVVHGDDERIPKETTDTYINAFNADSYTAEGFTHSIDRDIVSDEQIEEYQTAIADWLRQQ